MLPRRSSRSHLPSAKSMDFSSPRHNHILAMQHNTPTPRPTPPPSAHSEQITLAPRQKPPQFAHVPHPARNTSTAPPTSLAIEANIETSYGDTAVLVGSIPELGSWRPLNGLRLATGPTCYPIWKARRTLQHSGEIQCKLVILRTCAHGEEPKVEWEPLEVNRTINLAGFTPLTLRWGRAGDLSSEVESSTTSIMAPGTESRTPIATSAATARAAAPMTQNAPIPLVPLTPPKASSKPPAQHLAVANQTPPLRAFTVAPAPNNSFSVTTASPTCLWSPVLAPPIPVQALATLMSRPLQASEVPSPRPAHGVERAVIGGPLEAIMSMDASWPPSLGTSQADSQHASCEELSLHESPLPM